MKQGEKIMIGIISRFLSGVNHKYVKPWFFSSDDPDRIKAPYVISFIFLVSTVLAISVHIAIKLWQFNVITGLWSRSGIDAIPQIETLSKLDMSLIPLISILIGTAGMFIGLYNWGKKGSAVIGYDNFQNPGFPAGDSRIRNDEV